MNGYPTASQEPGTRLIDDFLRRELRVGDPKNAIEIASALRRRYALEATRIDDEGTGMPLRFFAEAITATVLTTTGDTPGSREERRVRGDLEADLNLLIDSPSNREWKPEITGWREVLLREFSDSAAAARFAQDPAQRERAFYATRKLSEFARLARLVGVLNLSLNSQYRRLATTLDEAASAVRILMGEALYQAGLADGGFMIQVPLVDMRVRRDGLVAALRRLTGALGNPEDDWGEGANAYRQLLSALNQRSAPELTVYLREEMFVPILDGLVSSVSRQDPEALRQIAATAPVELARMGRLLGVVADLSTPAPPGAPPNPLAAPLSGFGQALQLFLDAFAQSRSGARLIDLAVPLPLAALQADEADREARRNLRDIVSGRGELAQEVECFLSCCGCDTDTLRCQVKLDKVLFDIDRAIDLYAQGEGRPPLWGDEEHRAGALGMVVRNMAAERACVANAVGFPPYPLVARVARASLEAATAAGRLATVMGLAGLGQAAEETVRVLKLALAATEAWHSSRYIGEALLRDLAAAIAAPGPLAPLPAPLPAQIAGILVASRALPLNTAMVIDVAMNVAETAAGRSAVAAIAGVPPGVGGVANAPVGVADFIFAAVAAAGPLGLLTAAQTAGTSAGVATRSSLSALDDNAGTRAAARAVLPTQQGQAQADADAALAVPDPPPPAPALSPTQRGALRAAADSGVASATVAGEVDALPAGDGTRPVALWATLDGLAATLSSTLPGAASPERGRLLAAVFDEQLRAELDWQDLVASLAPTCLGPGRAELATAGRELLFANPSNVFGTPKRAQMAAPPPDERVGIADIARRLPFPPPGTPGTGGPAPSPAPTIRAFITDRTTVAPGGTAILTWSTTNAASVSIDQGVGSALPTSSRIAVIVNATTTYTLTATGPGGGPVKAGVTVTVVPPPTIASLTASPRTISPGGFAALTWTTTDATCVDIDNGGGTGLPASSSTVVTPARTTTYTLTATGPGGTKTQQVTVTVAPPTIDHFVAIPDTIGVGEQATLIWATTDASDVEIDNGVGRLGTSGSAIVKPRASTTYTLTATGPGGTVTQQTAVKVTGVHPPPPKYLTQEELTALRYLLAVTFHAIKNCNAPTEWNDWMRHVREGRAFGSPTEFSYRQEALSSERILGWNETPASEARTLNQAVKDVARPYEHQLFEDLFADAAKADFKDLREFRETKNSLLERCAEVEEHYRSETKS